MEGPALTHYLGCRLLTRNATSFLMDDIYRNPGPLQFDGPGADAKPITLSVEDQDYMGRIKKLQEYLEQVLTINLLYVNSTRAFREKLSYLMSDITLKKKKSNLMVYTKHFKITIC